MNKTPRVAPKSYARTRNLLLILTGFAFALLLFINVGHAGDVSITFQWDADVYQPDDEHMKWEALHIYERLDSATYVYGNVDGEPTPKASLTQSYAPAGANEESAPVTYKLDTTVPDGVQTQLYWIIRAAANCTDPADPATCSIESADSEEVGLLFDLTPVLAFDFTAVFNDTTNTIDMAWQNTDARITKWDIFTADVSGGPYTVLTTVNVADATTSYSIPEDDLFPDGQLTVKYFTMVAHAPYGVFSPNSPEVTISRDRIGPPTNVVNFKIVLTE